MKRILLLAVFSLLFGITSVFAQPKNDGKPNFEGKRWSNLNLTTDQKTKIEQLHIEHRKEVVDLKADIEKLRLEIKSELNKDQISQNKIKDLANKINNVQAKLKESAIDNWFTVYNLLDADQKTKFKDKFPRFAEDGRNHRDGKGMHMRKHPDGKGMRNNQSAD